MYFRKHACAASQATLAWEGDYMYGADEATVAPRPMGGS